MLVSNQLPGIGIWLMLYGYSYLYVFIIGAVLNK